MCTRYLSDQEQMIERYGLDGGPPVMGGGSKEVRPTDPALVITATGTGAVKNWGLEVSWQKGPIVNARSETLTEKPTFRNMLEKRCLIPATGYFEWRQDGRHKVKTRLNLKDDTAFSFAGFYTASQFVMCTCVPAAGIAHIHNRMPVILTERAEKDWLDPDLDFSQVAHHLLPFGGEIMFEDADPKSTQARQMSLF